MVSLHIVLYTHTQHMFQLFLVNENAKKPYLGRKRPDKLEIQKRLSYSHVVVYSIQLLADIPVSIIIKEIVQTINQTKVLYLYLLLGTRRFLVAVGKIECEEWDLSSFF